MKELIQATLVPAYETQMMMMVSMGCAVPKNTSEAYADCINNIAESLGISTHSEEDATGLDDDSDQGDTVNELLEAITLKGKSCSDASQNNLSESGPVLPSDTVQQPRAVVSNLRCDRRVLQPLNIENENLEVCCYMKDALTHRFGATGAL